ncbi:MAG: hypothetical protein IJX29_02670 [Bacteroides sp.]|nr:hypothetical protein [Bacteroides sp.]
MKRFFLSLVAVCMYLAVSAQALAPITWTAFGLTFNAPRGILVEEDTEDTFLLNNSRFYITIHSLDSEDMTKEDMNELLKGLAEDDGVENQSEVKAFDLPQFHGIYLSGVAEGDPCRYACLMTKDAGSVYYISIIYNRTDDKVVDRILKSFKMEEDMTE